jgi:hypothetical protein
MTVTQAQGQTVKKERGGKVEGQRYLVIGKVQLHQELIKRAIKHRILGRSSVVHMFK